jgi:hypothetical protein
MFTRSAVVATTLIIAGSLTFGTTATAFAVDGDPTPADSTSVDPGTSASIAPAADAAPAPAAAVMPEAVPAPAVAVAASPASAPCIPSSAVSYTYDPATNSGTITVPDVAGSTGLLCNPFYVTATSWRFTTTQIWPQRRDVVQKLVISGVGTTDYSAPVTCGQGDIYASFYAQPDPPVILTQSSIVVEPPAPTPGAPFTENFLDYLGFAGPGPTYTAQDPSCMISGTGLTTLAIQPIAAVSSPETCTTSGAITSGSITVGQVGGVDFTPYVSYSIDGVPASAITTAVPTGTHTVTAVALSGNALEAGPNTLIDGTAAFTVSVAPATGCSAVDASSVTSTTSTSSTTPGFGDLSTLALHDEGDPATLASTGVDDSLAIATAAMLLATGLALIAGRTAIARRRRSVV